jgi:hypothetical protein
MPNGALPYPNLAKGAIVFSGPSVTVDDGRENIFNRPYTVWGMSLGYSFKTGGRFRQRVQISGKNLFNRIYTYGAGIPADPRMILTTYSIAF